MDNLQAIINDSRIHLSTFNGIYYAEFVEENGDVFELHRAYSVHEMQEALTGMGYLKEQCKMQKLKTYTVSVEVTEVVAESKDEALVLAMTDISEWQGKEDGIIIKVKEKGGTA